MTTTLNILQYVVRGLRQTVGHWPELARQTGVPYRTLEKIGREDTRNPRVNHIIVLARHFGYPAPLRAKRQTRKGR